MAKIRSRKKHIFLGLSIAILLIGVVLLAACARILTSILVEYEASRPEHFVSLYENSFDEEHVRRISQDIDIEYDHNLMNAETFREMFVRDFSFNAEFTCKRNGTLCVGNQMGYYVLANGGRIGTVVIEQEACPAISDSDRLLKAVSEKLSSILGCSYGNWHVVSESFDFSTPTVTPVSVSVPPDWSVKCNGYTLDESYIVGEPKMIETFKDYYENFELPYLITYEVSSYIGDSTLDVYDPDGNLVVLSDNSAENDQLFVKDFFDNDNDEVISFTKEFLNRYITYCSNSNQMRYDNLARLRAVLVPDSDFESRMIQALEGQYYAHSRGDVITDITIIAIIRCDDFWLVDFSYTLDTTGNAGVVSTTHNARINIVDYNGSMRVEKLISY